MRELIRKKWLWICLAAVAIAAFAGASAYAAPSRGDVITAAVDTAMRPAKLIVTRLVDRFEQWYDYVARYDRLEAENEALRRRLAELEINETRYGTALEENEALRQMLDFTTGNPAYEFVAVSVISRSASPWAATCTISKGTDAGIRVGQCVVDQDNRFFGIVTAADGAGATVTAATDTSLGVGAVLNTSGLTGAAGGDYALLPQGLLQVRYLTGEGEAVPGEYVLTSGSDMIPGGLLLGYVRETVTDRTGLEKFVTVAPAASFDRPGLLYVVTAFTVPEGVAP